MGNTWGVHGPPSQAHSRVSRDLRAVTAGFGDYLDQLPRDLTARFASRVRQAAPSERERVRGQATFAVDEAVTVVPDGADRASLVPVRGRFEGGSGPLSASGVRSPRCCRSASATPAMRTVSHSWSRPRSTCVWSPRVSSSSDGPTAPASVRGFSAARRWRLVTGGQLAAGVRPALTSPASRSPSSGAAGCRDGPAPAENNGARLTRRGADRPQRGMSGVGGSWVGCQLSRVRW